MVDYPLKCCPDCGEYFISTRQRIELTKGGINADGIYEQVIKNVHDGDKNTPAQDRAIIQDQYGQLREGLREGAGKLSVNVEYGTPNHTMLKNLQTNVASFSAFKKHDMMKELVKELKDSEGNLRSFHEFKKTANPLVGKYKEEWLQNEYDAAVRGSRMATQWQGYQATKRIYPNLEYTLSRSAHLREDHLLLVGTILPIDHPFWNEHFPPNGWGCKCGTKNVDKEVTEEPPHVSIDKNFAFNAGKEGIVFDLKTHPYAQMPQKEYKQALHDARGAAVKYEEKEFMKKTGEALKKLSVRVPKLSEPVEFNRNSFTHNFQISDYFLDKLSILNNIEQHLKESTYITPLPNHKPAKRDVKQYHVLAMKGKPVNFILEERTEKNGGNIYLYMIKLVGGVK